MECKNILIMVVFINRTISYHKTGLGAMYILSNAIQCVLEPSLDSNLYYFILSLDKLLFLFCCHEIA